MPVILSSGVIVGLEFNNALLKDMKDVIADTSNASSITTVLQDMLVAESSQAGDMFQYVFDLIDSVYDIANFIVRTAEEVDYSIYNVDKNQ